MKYQLYRTVKGKEEYFKGWDNANYKDLTEELKDQIYQKYQIRCEIYKRDNFVCQNVECETPDSKLTMHHVKAQRNGGAHKARNCVTLCDTCHRGYERAKRTIVLNGNNLPSHIRGHTFKLEKPSGINWKEVKIRMRKLRRSLHNECNLKISWEQLYTLMKFLEKEVKLDDI